MKNKKNITIIIMSIIIITLTSLIILLIYNKNINHNLQENKNNIEENTNKTNNTTTETPDEKPNANWIDELLSYHILDAKISRLRTKDLGDSEEIDKTITINLDDVKKILSQFKNNNLLKTYSIGRGGPQKDALTINYEYNEKKYKFEIINGTFNIDTLNEELINMLNNNNYEEKNTEYKNQEESFYFYDIIEYSDQIFDEYFK